MFSFLIKKMLNNKWMIISLLIGNILLVGVVASVPLYSVATLQRMLTKDLEQYQIDSDIYPGTLDAKYQFYYVDEAGAIATYQEMTNNVLPEMIRQFDIPVNLRVEILNLTSTNMISLSGREANPKNRTLTVYGYSDIPEHINITQGRMYTDEITDGIIEAIVTQRTMDAQSLLLGDVLEAQRISLDGEKLLVKIVGVFENTYDTDYYWSTSLASMESRLFISYDLMKDQFVMNYKKDYRVEATWQTVFDYHQIDVRYTDYYTQVYDQYANYFTKTLHGFNIKAQFPSIIASYQQRADKLDITLWVLQAPIFLMLAFFIFMVSKQILLIEQNEISVIKSRGASRRQIITMYAMQAFIISAVSYCAGIPLGVMICKLLGASNGFLNLVGRTALKVILTPQCFIYALVAVIFSILTMTVPVIGYSRVTIVDHKRSRGGKMPKSIWQMFFLDFLALGIACYGLYSFTRQKEIMALTVVDIQSVDPLLFLSSSLFIVGGGLVALRFFPYLVKLIFLMGKKFWSPSLYASFVNVIRSVKDEQFIMLFLILTLALGIFDAKTARTINLNMEDKIRYQTGADLRFKEVWWDNTLPDYGEGPVEQPSDIYYIEPDIERFTSLDGSESVTKVLNASVSVNRSSGGLNNVRLNAIHTKTFGETAWYREDLLPGDFYDYLNALAQTPNAVLLSSNFKEYDYKIGDVINYREQQMGYVQGIIYGFVDYWPGYTKYSKAKGADGKIYEKEDWLIIANLSFLQSKWGVTPYEIWMKTKNGSSVFIYDFAESENLRFATFKDSNAGIIESRNDPMLQGTNGVLTVGFIITLLVCSVGFLIFWILSIRSRVLQFGIFRAMGMSMRSISALLINEQLLVSGVAMFIGVGVGEAASRLFVPLIQMSYSASEQAIPLKITTEFIDYIRLWSVVGAMVVVCIVVLGTIISRIKIAQALKLGED